MRVEWPTASVTVMALQGAAAAGFATALVLPAHPVPPGTLMPAPTVPTPTVTVMVTKRPSRPPGRDTGREDAGRREPRRTAEPGLSRPRRPDPGQDRRSPRRRPSPSPTFTTGPTPPAPPAPPPAPAPPAPTTGPTPTGKPHTQSVDSAGRTRKNHPQRSATTWQRGKGVPR